MSDPMSQFTSSSSSEDGSTDETSSLKPNHLARIPLAILLVVALMGASFSATSTSDFVQHLDREVHKIHCSFVPGASEAELESPCRTVMLSPYSSWFRQDYWGGLPVSLFAIAVFAFLAYRAAHLLWRGQPRKSDGFFLTAATLLPLGMSGIFYWLAVNKVGAICKTCQGIYWTSVACFVAAVLTWVMSSGSDGKGIQRFFIGVVEGVAFVGVLTLVYLGAVPKADANAGGAKGCGTLVQPNDDNGIMFPIDSHPGGASTIELLDPLCPSCRAFDVRLKATQLRDKLDIKAVLFPLDSTCNWMVSGSMHPGACAVSEAMLCAAGAVDGKGSPAEAAEARKILDWAFAEQESLTAMAKADEKKLRAEIETKFPAVKGCLGGHNVQNKLNKSLRWAVANALSLLTPQVFVNGTRMCDEDTDLGLEFTLARMLEKTGAAPAGGAK